MRNFDRKYSLQFFADGADGGDGAGAGTSTGENAAVAGQQAGENTVVAGQTAQSESRSLEDLGVPKSKAEKYRAIKAKQGVNTAASTNAAATAEQQANNQAAAQNTGNAQQDAAATQSEQVQQPSTMDWDELMKNPELNSKMQATIRDAKKKTQARLDSLNPVLELLGKAYDIDTSDLSKMDIGALTKAMASDDHFYEKRAAEMGMDVDDAKRTIQRDMAQNARDRELTNRENTLRETVEDMAVRRHIEKLENDAAALKKLYPSFDLKKEMSNSRFAAMVSPSGGLSVSEAYFALHHNEIEQARAAEAARSTAQAYSNAIMSGRGIPAENGSTSRTSSTVTTKRYSDMNKEERAAYKAQLMNSSTRR